MCKHESHHVLSCLLLLDWIGTNRPYCTNLVAVQSKAANLPAGYIMMVLWGSEIMALYLLQRLFISAGELVHFPRYDVLNSSTDLPNRRTRNHCPPSCRKNAIITELLLQGGCLLTWSADFHRSLQITVFECIANLYPRWSMYGIFTYIWVIYGVNM